MKFFVIPVITGVEGTAAEGLNVYLETVPWKLQRQLY